MRFFTPTDDFTHYGSFYKIPVYVNMSGEELVIGGTNIVFDVLFFAATLMHNIVIERSAQMLAAVTDSPYEPGFPVMIKGELVDETL